MYLRCAISDTPKKWFQWLHLDEFWYNNSFHTSLQCAPLEALYGTDPNYGMMPDLSQVTNSEAVDISEEREQFSAMLKNKLGRA